MTELHSRLGLLAAGPLWLAGGLLALGACTHDWDQWLPPAAPPPGTGGSGAEAGAGAGAGAQGGGGPIEVPGSCPEAPNNTPLVKVATVAGKALCIERTEVTRGLYEQWLGTSPPTGGQPAECGWNVDFTPASDWPPQGIGPDRPVAFVDWCDALAYCAAHGKRLCGAVGGGASPFGGYADAELSEWFDACTDRGHNLFPYGGSYDPKACNGKEQGLGGTGNVGELAGCRGRYEVLDLSGNLWEWEDSCTDKLDAKDSCRIRGGGFNNSADNLDCGADATAKRDEPRVNVGIRCCANALP
ncbi:MAG: SUMF1/EgtB/PvdO family nonheme iron enzyme [Deltaproteobacteria bacterium]|nr:SUMF1/EgtB/PvdO family nonheme iron enzyme [Deltaproteobacteria bacterium]